MKILGFILTLLFCIVPSLWIENYMFSPAFWTVFVALLVGKFFGYIDKAIEK